MKREIVTIIKGMTSELLTYWQPPQDIEVEVMEDGKRLEMVFLDNNFSEFYKLENLINELKVKHEIELISFFKAYDFSKEDIEASDLLWLMVSETDGLEIEGVSPIKESRCRKCGQVNIKIEKINHLNLRYHQRSAKKLKSHILATRTIKLFHHDLIEDIKNNKADSELKIIPCLIKGKDNVLLEDYSWVYSIFDLGLPTCGLKFGKACTECETPEVLDDRSFIKTFYRNKWYGEDFCTSSFFGMDSLYVSQKVFKLIDSLQSDLKGDIIFQPIALI